MAGLGDFDVNVVRVLVARISLLLHLIFVNQFFCYPMIADTLIGLEYLLDYESTVQETSLQLTQIQELESILFENDEIVHLRYI